MRRVILLATLLSACVIGSKKYDRPSELPASWLIDRVRLLAVVADPPEARPGETVTFQALLVDPNDEVGLVAWIACPPADNEDDVLVQCGSQLADLDLEGATPEELAALGVIGIQPFFDPVYVPPADLLEDLDDDARREGVEVTISIAALPASLLDSGGAEGSFDYNDVESGYKRLVVSEADTPNHNPVVTGWTVSGVPVDPQAVVELRGGERFDLGITLSEESVEDYVYVDSNGDAENRTEEPYADWYCTSGEMFEPNTLWPHFEAAWIAPDEPGTTGTWWAVVRDRRGGMAWTEQRYAIR